MFTQLPLRALFVLVIVIVIASPTIAQQPAELEQLRADNARLQKENAALKKEVKRLKALAGIVETDDRAVLEARKITETKDEKTGETRVATRTSQLTVINGTRAKHTLTLQFNQASGEAPGDQRVEMIIRKYSYARVYRGVKTITFTIDDKTRTLPITDNRALRRGTRGTRTRTTLYDEILTARLPADLASAIGAAHTVTAKAGRVELKLTAGQLALFKAMAQRRGGVDVGGSN